MCHVSVHESHKLLWSLQMVACWLLCYVSIVWLQVVPRIRLRDQRQTISVCPPAVFGNWAFCLASAHSPSPCASVQLVRSQTVDAPHLHTFFGDHEGTKDKTAHRLCFEAVSTGQYSSGPVGLHAGQPA